MNLLQWHQTSSHRPSAFCVRQEPDIYLGNRLMTSHNWHLIVFESLHCLKNFQTLDVGGGIFTALSLEIRARHLSGKQTDEITNAIVNMIVLDYLPLSLVEGKGFLKLMSVVAPDYKVPTRNTIKSRKLPNFRCRRWHFHSPISRNSIQTHF
jgi:hypothetical protein